MTTKPLEIRNILSKNVKEHRKRQGISQEKLAEITGLSVQTINDIEGCRKWVSDKTITKRSSAFNLECYQLLIPDFISRNKRETTPTQNLLMLKDKMHKGADAFIETQFTEFIKAGLLK